MTEKTYAGVVISDFNADNLAALLTNSDEHPRIQARPAPYGQVYQVLMDPNSEYWKDDPDFAVVWTRPQGVIRSFQDVLEYTQPDLERVLDEVDQYAALLTGLKERVKFVFVPTWVLPPKQRGYGMLDLRDGIGVRNILMQMNLRLAEFLDEASNVYMLDADRWTGLVGSQAFNPKLWYMGKIGFSSQVFQIAAREMKAAMRGLEGQARKLIVLDLDDTLWGGIVGDDGWENLSLGGHSPVGEAFVDFQKALKALTNRGIVLGIASKNDEQVALEAIDSHPEMVLRRDDFAGWKINWNDKAQNIVDLVSELNLGLQSVVFIDDNPIERARVSEMLPEVLVPDWPEDKTQYVQALLGLDCFDSPGVSKEDARRTEMYVTERQRRELRTNVGSMDDWLQNLGIHVQVEELNETNLARAAQLFNKTNQMNMSTRRMTDSELVEWASGEGRKLWTIRISDKFGDSGLTGIVSLEAEGERGRIVDYLLSCRVMGRKVEETMVAVAVQAAREMGLQEVYAVYQPTKKNRPCLEFWQNSGFSCAEDPHTFRWPAQGKKESLPEYPFPLQVQVERL